MSTSTTSAAVPNIAKKESFLDLLTQHPPGFWFIFWGEFAERCSYYGMRAILVLYMAEQLNLGKASALTFNSLFLAACYFLPLIGGGRTRLQPVFAGVNCETFCGICVIASATLTMPRRCISLASIVVIGLGEM